MLKIGPPDRSERPSTERPQNRVYRPSGERECARRRRQGAWLNQVKSHQAGSVQPAHIFGNISPLPPCGPVVVGEGEDFVDVAMRLDGILQKLEAPHRAP